jgi:hypothetical protein
LTARESALFAADFAIPSSWSNPIAGLARSKERGEVLSRPRYVGASIAIIAILASLVMASSASATYHLIKIRSIFRGPSGSPSGAWVELQMHAPVQNFVGGHQIRIYTATATTFSGFTLPSNVATGENQRRILIGDSSAPGSPDFTVAGIGTSLTNLAAGGAACWDVVDCVSWGNFTGNALLPSPAGTPIAGGLSGSMVSVRSIGANCPTALDAADDTDNSSADFGFAVGYMPRNNSLAPTETLCSSSGPPPVTPGAPTPNTPKKKKCKKRKRSSTAPGTGSGTTNPPAYAAKKKCKKKRK